MVAGEMWLSESQQPAQLVRNLKVPTYQKSSFSGMPDVFTKPIFLEGQTLKLLGPKIITQEKQKKPIMRSRLDYWKKFGFKYGKILSCSQFMYIKLLNIV